MNSPIYSNSRRCLQVLEVRVPAASDLCVAGLGAELSAAADSFYFRLPVIGPGFVRFRVGMWTASQCAVAATLEKVNTKNSEKP